MDWIDFEMLIMEYCSNEEIKTSDQLERFSEKLHEHIELAIQDYCYDNGIEDYEPYYM